jgi:hypothetical protein
MDGNGAADVVMQTNFLLPLCILLTYRHMHYQWTNGSSECIIYALSLVLSMSDEPRFEGLHLILITLSLSSIVACPLFASTSMLVIKTDPIS